MSAVSPDGADASPTLTASPTGGRRSRRHCGVHESRAGARPARRQAHRHLGVRQRAVRDADRPPSRLPAARLPTSFAVHRQPRSGLECATAGNAAPRFASCLRRCLQKDPVRRLRDIGDARLELDDAALGARRSGSVSRRCVSRSNVPAVLRVGGGRRSRRCWPWRPSSFPGGLAAARDTVRDAVQSRHQLCRRRSATLAFRRMAARVAFVSNRDGQWDVYVGMVTGGGLVPPDESISNIEARPRWSPDGTKLLYLASERLRIAGHLGHAGISRHATPGRSERLRSGLVRRRPHHRLQLGEYRFGSSDADGANARQVTKPEPPPLFHDQPAFAHERPIACVHPAPAWAPQRTCPGRPGHGRPCVLSRTTKRWPYRRSWSPDDRFIYFSSSRGGTLNIWRLTVATTDARTDHGRSGRRCRNRFVHGRPADPVF